MDWWGFLFKYNVVHAVWFAELGLTGYEIKLSTNRTAAQGIMHLTDERQRLSTVVFNNYYIISRDNSMFMGACFALFSDGMLTCYTRNGYPVHVSHLSLHERCIRITRASIIQHEDLVNCEHLVYTMSHR